ncbi:ATP-binding protein [Emcibacter sp.]|uniref:sensor histidine kinase n=1 Tax=Emcibacter sp. TaxID=1979954 RepID=UPI003A8C9EC4
MNFFTAFSTFKWLLPLVILLMGIGGTTWLTREQLSREGAAINDAAQIAISSISRELSLILNKDIRALQRMAGRRQNNPEMMEGIWRADARNYVSDMEAVSAIEWVDSQFRVKWIEPIAGNEAAIGLDLMFEERRAESLLSAAEMNVPHVTRVIELVQGGAGFLVCVPVGSGPSFDGFIVGVFKFADLFKASVLQTALGDFELQFREDDVLDIPVSPGVAGNGNPFLVSALEVPDRDWKIAGRPTAVFISQRRSQLAVITFGTGLLVSILISCLVYFYISLEHQMVARRHADEANKEKSRFLASISHDLRTPLNAIIGFSELMNGKVFGAVGSEKYEGYIRGINGAGNYLLSLINDLLDHSAIEAGERQLHKETLNLQDIADECDVVLRTEIAAKSIDLTFDISERLPPLFADYRAVKQIFINLLSNAVKFTPPGGRIWVRARATRKGHKIEFGDSGIGIPENQIGEVTKPFFTEQDDPYHSRNGTGLGLAIVNSLIDLHEGKLDITSRVGKGTVIRVSLPRSGDNDKLRCSLRPN